jgi:hypothetical protein
MALHGHTPQITLFWDTLKIRYRDFGPGNSTDGGPLDHSVQAAAHWTARRLGGWACPNHPTFLNEELPITETATPRADRNARVLRK